MSLFTTFSNYYSTSMLFISGKFRSSHQKSYKEIRKEEIKIKILIKNYIMKASKIQLLDD